MLESNCAMFKSMITLSHQLDILFFMLVCYLLIIPILKKNILVDFYPTFGIIVSQILVFQPNYTILKNLTPLLSHLDLSLLNFNAI